jgi:hypothetical protein
VYVRERVRARTGFLDTLLCLSHVC